VRAFVKQYGAERSGTNLLRLLLARHLPDATVLMHALGDKHAAPVDLGAVAAATDSALAFATEATLRAPAAPLGPAERAHLATLAPALHRAWRAGELRFVLSVRDPLSWAVSALGARHVPVAPADPAAEAATVAALGALCASLNRRMAAWLALVDAHPGRAAVVRHERLLADPSAVLEQLAEALALPPLAGLPVRLPAQGVRAARWDGEPPALGPLAAQRPRPRLSGALRAAVIAGVDWRPFERLGCVTPR
jgi:hypothetical protein